ncbi:MAG: peptidylprolyl isomerase [Succinivibrio sp.]|nr:peptidylprolyl isomerase [Succinivibrio sp.]
MMTEVRASHLLVQTEDEAKSLREEILNGKKFEDVAAAVSLCPSGANGGDLGFFGKGVMVREFEEAAFSMNVGDLSEPIQTQFGWHLIHVIDKK